MDQNEVVKSMTVWGAILLSAVMLAKMLVPRQTVFITVVRVVTFAFALALTGFISAISKALQVTDPSAAIIWGVLLIGVLAAVVQAAVWIWKCKKTTSTSSGDAEN